MGDGRSRGLQVAAVISKTRSEKLTKRIQRISLAAILAGAIGVPAGVPASIPTEVLPMTPAPARLPVEGEFPSLGGTGERDANWSDWYAAYMVAEQAGTELPL